MSVHHWVHRYQDQGIAGLETKAGRGRKTILQEDDLESVRAAVAEHRQRPSSVLAELEQVLGKSFSQETLARFVKKWWTLRYKRLRKRPRREPLPEVYELKVEGLSLLESMSQKGWMDLFYGDESRISLEPLAPLEPLEPCVP